MKTEEKTKRLLEMQEHPERYTEEEIRQLMADDECRQIYEQMVRGTDAVFAETVSTPQAHSRPSVASPQALPTPVGAGLGAGSVILKLAAAFIGLLLLSGITYAAIRIAHQHQQSEASPADTIAAVNSSILQSFNSSHPQDSTAQPRLYDNVHLGEILDELSTYYNITVVYRTEEARHPRLYYQWKPEYTIEKVVEMLNNFEWLQMEFANDTLYVKSTAIPADDC